MIETAY